MGVLQRTVTQTHRIGERGRVQIKGVTGAIRVSGVDGDTATIRIKYRVRAADQASAERALEQAEVRVERTPNGILVETPERRLSSGLAWLFGGSRVTAEIEAAVPRGAEVSLETVSGSIDAAGFIGDQRYRTVSGDVSLWTVSGAADASTVSGSVSVDGDGELSLKANSVSGSVTARSPRFSRLRLSTTSGTIAVDGELAPNGEYRADSVSGSLELATPSGLVADLKTLSGTIRSDVEHRLEGGRGQWRATVGDGGAKVRFNSTSGSIYLRRASDGARPRGGWTERVATKPAGFAAAIVLGGKAETEAFMPATPDHESEHATGPADAGEAAATARAAVEEPEAPAETWSGDAEPEPGESAATEAPPAAPQDELELLRAVERGELSVEEAASRLEQLRR